MFVEEKGKNGFEGKGKQDGGYRICLVRLKEQATSQTPGT